MKTSAIVHRMCGAANLHPNQVLFQLFVVLPPEAFPVNGSFHPQFCRLVFSGKGAST